MCAQFRDAPVGEAPTGARWLVDVNAFRHGELSRPIGSYVCRARRSEAARAPGTAHGDARFGALQDEATPRRPVPWRAHIAGIVTAVGDRRPPCQAPRWYSATEMIRCARVSQRMHFSAPRTSGQLHAGDARKQMLILVVTLDQAVVRNAGRQVVNVVIADIDGEPVQPGRQHQEARAFHRSGVGVPVRVVARIGVLEVVLHREQHDARAARDRYAEQIDGRRTARFRTPSTSSAQMLSRTRLFQSMCRYSRADFQ